MYMSRRSCPTCCQLRSSPSLTYPARSAARHDLFPRLDIQFDAVNPLTDNPQYEMAARAAVT